MKTAVSVKAQLKYRAQKENHNVQDIFTIYVLERVLYRLSISSYMENFTIKGGILLYGLFNEQYARVTTDIDLLGVRISNDAEQLKEIFLEILSIECDDAVRFDMETISVKNITEFKKYHGVNVSVLAYLDRTRIPVNIDVGFGDVIYPQKQKMEYPTILNDDAPILYAYSMESIIAEKFEAIVSLGSVNSRYKDFYDICRLSERYDFNGNDLQEAIEETFEHRGTAFEEIAAFEENFAEDPYRKGRWKGFVKSKRADTDLTLQEAIDHIRSFLGPIVDAIQTGQKIRCVWRHEDRKWAD